MVRCSSRTPSRASRSATWRETLAFERPSASAAATKLPASTTAENTRISSKRSMTPTRSDLAATLLRPRQQTQLRRLRGKYEWVGDPDAMGRDR